MTESIRPRSAFIVDDEYLVAFDIEASMREIGFEACIVASNENDAIDLAKSSRPDVVVMDVYLGGSHGGDRDCQVVSRILWCTHRFCHCTHR